MDGTLAILLVALAASVPAALAQELARGAVALALTRGRVCVLLGEGRARRSLRVGRLLVGVTARWWWGGECLHAPGVSRRRRHAIVLAGPVAGDLCFVAAAAAAATWHGGPSHHPLLHLALWVFALVALLRASVELVQARGAGRPGPAATAR